MSDENKGLETELESLFDETAHPADTHGLTRMTARAKDIPGSTRPNGWRAWFPTLVLAFAGLAALAMFVPRTEEPSSEVPLAAAVEETPAAVVGSPKNADVPPPTQEDEDRFIGGDEADLPFAVIFDVGWGADDDEDFHLAGGNDDDLSPDELVATYDEVLAQDG